MEHDIHLGCLGEYHVPWVDQSLYSPHEYVGDVTIPTQVIKYNQNFLQAD
jgi:hypothetical protein